MDRYKAQVRTYFSEVAVQYAKMYESEGFRHYPAGAMRLEKALKFLERWKPAGKVLDAGCGTGVLAVELLARGYEAACLDISREMVEFTRELVRKTPEAGSGRATFAVGDVENLDASDASYDAVVALGLVEYLAADEPMLSEFRRVLKPGGLAIVAYPNRLFNLFSFNRFTEGEFASGERDRLLAELQAELQADSPLVSFEAYIRRLSECRPRPPVEEVGKERGPVLPVRPFEIRRHTPSEARGAAAALGFQCLGTAYFHFHPFPPIFEGADPEGFNRMGVAMEVLDETPIGACMASAFVTAFARG